MFERSASVYVEFLELLGWCFLVRFSFYSILILGVFLVTLISWF